MLDFGADIAEYSGRAGPVADRRNRGFRAYRSGTAAEDSIARDYQRRGFSIARRRWRGKGGEIDLIARRDAGVIFIEVKAARDFATAAERLGARQMQRLYSAASEFLEGEPAGQFTEARFDVALVDGRGAFEIVENAFGA
ncbi:MAG: YraN family protein [Antarcticimicrobium sp.]|uniref:YraN family protein n=1 Tax=Antarcticimicrobium sp. TaxID=2824147 RepID=UPI002638DD8B|nr:YraN family protein [Antarcticimicrobium sp.]MDF1717658.1 YraN family protein [Antarcticimicrobium sp.]